MFRVTKLMLLALRRRTARPENVFLDTCKWLCHKCWFLSFLFLQACLCLFLHLDMQQICSYDGGRQEVLGDDILIFSTSPSLDYITV